MIYPSAKTRVTLPEQFLTEFLSSASTTNASNSTRKAWIGNLWVLLHLELDYQFLFYLNLSFFLSLSLSFLLFISVSACWPHCCVFNRFQMHLTTSTGPAVFRFRPKVGSSSAATSPHWTKLKYLQHMMEIGNLGRPCTEEELIQVTALYRYVTVLFL